MIKYSKHPQIDTDVEKRIGKYCLESGYKIASAESCTGGLISHRITNQPGSSNYFLGGVIAYDYAVKRALLNVKQKTLENYGAVSKETALEMAAGTRSGLSIEVPPEKVIGISVTGIAGPDGGTPEKPVGLVWIGVSNHRFEKAVSHVWNGDRLANKEYSSQAALNMLLDTLQTLVRYLEVQVQASVNFSGSLDPQFIMLENKPMPVTAIGRRWQDEMGTHILIMIPGERVIELVSKNGKGWLYRPVTDRVRFG